MLGFARTEGRWFQAEGWVVDGFKYDLDRSLYDSVREVRDTQWSLASGRLRDVYATGFPSRPFFGENLGFYVFQHASSGAVNGYIANTRSCWAVIFSEFPIGSVPKFVEFEQVEHIIVLPVLLVGISV
jgi:hypothetical protein